MPNEHGFLLPDEKHTLLRRYAPVLVLCPEDERHAPYPEEGDAIYTIRGSYHPRVVEFFLRLARVRYKWLVLLRRPLLRFFPRSYKDEIDAARRTITPGEIDAAIEAYQHDPRYAGLSGDNLRTAIMDRLVQERLSHRISSLDLPIHRAKNLKHWRAYFRYLNEAPPADRRAAVYGRVVQGLVPLSRGDAVAAAPHEPPYSGFGPIDVSQTRIALQYWFQYYYDDWANRHEGDLESVTLLLELNEDLIAARQPIPAESLLAGVTVLEAGYADHEDGYRRQWEDVQKTRTDRPIVYVARGSSASYFSWRLAGYPASARVGFIEKLLTIPGAVIGARRFLGRRWDTQYFARFTARGPKNTDWVAADPAADDRLGTEPRAINTLERLVAAECRGVRRTPATDLAAGNNPDTYYLETNNLFWIEMAQEYGLQWGQDSLFPGTKGPRGLNKQERDKKAAQIDRLMRLETRTSDALNTIERALSQLSERRLAVTNAIPQLEDALRPLRPANLREADAFPREIRSYVYTMWAWILKVHPEAWPGGPGLINRMKFAWQLRPGLFSIFYWQRRFQPLLDRQDPLYHIKTLMARVRQTRYETQHNGSKWDNPFSWVRYTCQADALYYGRQPKQTFSEKDLQLIDCEDTTLSMK